MTDNVLDKVAGGFDSSAGQHSGQPLFRPEAMDALKIKAFGSPVARLPVSWQLLTAFLLVLVLSLASFLVISSYDRKEAVSGMIRSVGGDIKVQSPSPGVITAVRVREGQRVRAGEVLLTIATTRSQAEGDSSEIAAARSLEREIADLRGRLDALDAAAAFDSDGGRARLVALEGERAGARASEMASIQRLKLAERALQRAEPVAAKGFISAESIRRRQEEIIAMKQAIAEARGRLDTLDGQAAEVRASQAARPFQLQQQRGQLLDQIARGERELEGYRAQQGFAIKAPAEGVITTLQASAGQAVDPQQLLMSISAPESGVVAELYVPSRAVGFLEAGQHVRIRYDAFPYQRFGAAGGTVQAISASVLRPDQLQTPVRLEEPVYRVLVKLEQPVVNAYGKAHRVQSGMALTADLVLERRSLAAWLLDPIRALAKGSGE